MLAMLTAVLLMMTVIPLSAFAVTETGGTTGECIWRLDGTVLTISGNGKMEDYDGFSWSNSAPWWSFDLTEVMIESGVTQIGSYAFYDCNGLESITIPASVTKIGNYAFEGCSNLASLTIPDGVTTIGDGAFSDCSNVTSITIPAGVTERIEQPKLCNLMPRNAKIFCTSYYQRTTFEKIT